jgi:hypothetical protein
VQCGPKASVSFMLVISARGLTVWDSALLSERFVRACVCVCVCVLFVAASQRIFLCVCVFFK